jgi:hypothetical protein
MLSIGVNTKGSDNDLIVVPRLLKVKGGAMVDFQNSKQISKKDYATEASKDVNKYDELYGYQKVKYNDGTPLVIRRSNTAPYEYVYKLVNLYGDGRYTSEYYKDTNVPSKLENGTARPQRELSDEEVLRHIQMLNLASDDVETSEVDPTNDENIVSSPDENLDIDDSQVDDVLNEKKDESKNCNL